MITDQDNINQRLSLQYGSNELEMDTYIYDMFRYSISYYIRSILSNEEIITALMCLSERIKDLPHNNIYELPKLTDKTDSILDNQKSPLLLMSIRKFAKMITNPQHHVNDITNYVLSECKKLPQDSNEVNATVMIVNGNMTATNAKIGSQIEKFNLE